MLFSLNKPIPRRLGSAFFVAVAFLLGSALSTREAFADTLATGVASGTLISLSPSDCVAANIPWAVFGGASNPPPGASLIYNNSGGNVDANGLADCVSFNSQVQYDTSGASNGTYYAYFSGSSVGAYNYSGYYLEYNIISGVVSFVQPVNVTRIISMSPRGVVASTTSLGLSTSTLVTGYLSPSDLSSSTVVVLNFANNGCSSLSVSAIQSVNSTCSFTQTFPLTSSGSFSVGTSTNFNYFGQWSYVASIENVNNSLCFFGFCLDSHSDDLTSSSTSFTVATSSPYDDLVSQIASTSAGIASLYNVASSSAYCNPFDGSFSIGNCMGFLFLPNASSTQVLLTGYAGSFLTRFPLGYLTSFISILSTTTVSSLPVINATVPSVIPGGGASVHLDLTHSMDFMLNATTGPFLNSSASSTQTFYQITDVYWDYLVDLGLLFYLISRILGSHVFSVGVINKEGGVGNKPYGPQKPK